MCVCERENECLCDCISMIKSQSGGCYDNTCIFKLLIQDYSPLRSSHYRRLLNKKKKKKITHIHRHTDTHPNYGLVSLEIGDLYTVCSKTFLHTGKKNPLTAPQTLPMYTICFLMYFLDHIYH